MSRAHLTLEATRLVSILSAENARADLVETCIHAWWRLIAPTLTPQDVEAIEQILAIQFPALKITSLASRSVLDDS
jgi:hypothetical protein